MAEVADNADIAPQGKWMYEVTLGTAGIMQLGWATAACQFSNEEGVGDSVDSYAYDGKRVQRWNISCKHFLMPHEHLQACLEGQYHHSWLP